MKSNEGDKLIREKMASLDALAGGIVFGKEEAWDKLQARMERKPAKRIALRYWMAAAAVLLIFVSVMTVYYYPAKQEVSIAKQEKVNAPVNNTAAPSMPVNTASENVALQTPSPAVNTEVKHRAVAVKLEEKKIQPVITAVQPIQVPVSENKVNENSIVNNTAPVTITKTAMKVVHINEVERPGAGEKATAANGSSVAVSKMKVVHVNQVEKEEIDIRELLRENRVTIGHFPFSHSLYNDNNSTTEEYHDPRNMLKAMFNTQN